MRIRFIALCICVWTLGGLNASATTLTVTTTADSGVGSLRATLVEAQNGDTIQFDPALSGQAITLTSASLTISKDISITGPGANLLTVKRSSAGGTPNFRIFVIVASRTVTISGITINNGYAQGSSFPSNSGGAIYCNSATLAITNAIISGNHSRYGGGICNFANTGDTSVTINASTLSDNFALYGGAIYSYGYTDNMGALVTLNDSTVSGNSAAISGGGITNTSTEGTTISNIKNSTISGNVASKMGGGLFNDRDSLAFVSNSTFSENSAATGGGAIFNNSLVSITGVQIGNTILKAGSSGGNILNQTGSVSSNGYNLSDDDGGGYLHASGDQTNTDPMLGPLQNNGGPTFTHELLNGSPALNAGNPGFAPPPDFDQRGPGFPRVLGGRIDIGSFEGKGGPPVPSTFLNISTRLRVLTGDNALIGGFIVTGTVPKRVIVRGIGPSLAKFGVPDALANPVLELHGPGGFSTISNDNWRDTQQAEIAGTGLAPTDDLESAIVAMLSPGAYTAVLLGNSGEVGVALVEAYDLNPATNAQLTNISTRGFVDSGDNAMIGGFIVGSGSTNASVLIRGIGPSLTAFGVPDALADPTLELHDNNGATIGSNDDWRETQEKEIEATGIAPTEDLESAILHYFVQGAYTAIVRGKSGTVGVALVEAYQLTDASTPIRGSTPTASSRALGISASRGENAMNRWARTKK